LLISEVYRQQNKALHESRADYGTSGHKWADSVSQFASACRARSVLDYGCGKGTLKRSLPDLRVEEYDPAFHEALPSPADLVACTDVLEHIEPDCLDEVLNDLRRCSLKATFLVIATRPAKKTLSDGRNAHLIVEGQRFWLPRLTDRWEIKQFLDMTGEIVVIGAPR
jgi:hypothetical protein